MLASTNLAAIHAAILAEPEADIHRLAYADCLEEMGDDQDRVRSEFIRVQIAMAAIKGSWNSLQERELWDSRLSDGDWNIVARGLPPEIDRQHIDQESFSSRKDVPMALWRRGFVDEIRCRLATWRKYGSQIVRAHPVTVVHLVDREPAVNGTYWWTWVRDDVRQEEYLRTSLPRSMWDELPDGDIGGARKQWVTTENAHAALSHACLAWAKSEAKSRVESTPGASPA